MVIVAPVLFTSAHPVRDFWLSPPSPCLCFVTLPHHRRPQGRPSIHPNSPPPSPLEVTMFQHPDIPSELVVSVSSLRLTDLVALAPLSPVSQVLQQFLLPCIPPAKCRRVTSFAARELAKSRRLESQLLHPTDLEMLVVFPVLCPSYPALADQRRPRARYPRLPCHRTGAAIPPKRPLPG